jgi:hypothetical protein
MGTPERDSLCLGDKFLASINSAFSGDTLGGVQTDNVGVGHSMPESNEMTPVGLKILDHWKCHRPKMVRALQRQKRLEEAVLGAQELTTDLLHDLAAIQRRDYQAA